MTDKIIYHKYGYGPNNALVCFHCECGCMQEFITTSETNCHGCGILHKVGEENDR